MVICSECTVYLWKKHANCKISVQIYCDELFDIYVLMKVKAWVPRFLIQSTTCPALNLFMC